MMNEQPKMLVILNAMSDDSRDSCFLRNIKNLIDNEMMDLYIDDQIKFIAFLHWLHIEHEKYLKYKIIDDILSMNNISQKIMDYENVVGRRTTQYIDNCENNLWEHYKKLFNSRKIVVTDEIIGECGKCLNTKQLKLTICNDKFCDDCLFKMNRCALCCATLFYDENDCNEDDCFCTQN